MQNPDLIEEFDPDLEILTCQSCCGIVADTDAKVLPGGIVCPNCYTQITQILRPKLGLKVKAAELKRRHRPNPTRRTVDRQALQIRSRASLDTIRALAAQRDTWGLFMLPYPTLQPHHLKVVNSVDPSDWLLNPTPLEKPKGLTANQVHGYVKPESIDHLIAYIRSQENSVQLVATEALTAATLSRATLKNLIECANKKVQFWALDTLRAIYEFELLNKQIALSLIAPYIMQDIDKGVLINKYERLIKIRTGSLMRALNQADDKGSISGNSIAKLMNFYGLDTDNINRAKVRLADCALLNIA